MTRYLGSAFALRETNTQSDIGSSGAFVKTMGGVSAYSDTIPVPETVPIVTLTVTDSFSGGTFTEPALTVATVPIAGLTVTDTYTVNAYGDTIPIPETVPINGLTVNDSTTGGVDTHDGDEYALRWWEKQHRRRQQIEDAQAVASSPGSPTTERVVGPVPAALIDALSPPAASVAIAETPAGMWTAFDDEQDLADIMELIS